MPTSTTRRSCLPRARETRPRRESRSTRRVTSGSRAIIRCEMSLQASRAGWLPRRIRSTLYCSLLSPAWVFKNRSHGSMMRADAIRMPSSTACSADAKALFCFSSPAMMLAISGGPRILVITTIVKRYFQGADVSRRRSRIGPQEGDQDVSAIPIGVTVPGWPENTWAIEFPTPPRSWTHHDAIVFIGTMSRCVPPRVAGDCEYVLEDSTDGILIRVTRPGMGEARTYAPLGIPADVRRQLMPGVQRTPQVLSLDDTDRQLCESIVLQPMGGAV